MKRKIACIVMALVLVIGLLPMGAIHTNAASYLNPSENVVYLVKQFEGFSASAYWDVSQYTIGYGTTGTAGQTITEAEADLALRAKLSQISDRVNQFAAANNLYLTQNKHDALVSFCFNCGTDWMTQGGRFYEAVVRNADVNTFLFAISLWANVGTKPDANLLNRRMAEANLYLNGVYSKSAPTAYTYTIFDANGGTPGNGGEDKMQGYLSGSNVNILVANPSLSGSTFGGWYTASRGGTGVKYLSAATAGKTLYAQYGVPASVVGTYANVRNGAGTNYTQIGTVNAGTQIVIVETTQVNGAMWGRFIDGWIALEYTNYNGINIPNNNGNTGYTNPINSGIVVANSGVNIRAGAGTNYAWVGSAVNGQSVTIYEIANVNGVNWGRIGDNRWICLSYVRLNNPITNVTPSTGTTSGTTTNPGVIWEGTTGTNNNGTYQVGTVNTNGLNVRSGAGVGNPIVGGLNRGAQVKVYSQTMVGNTPWGKIDQGWVCMNYITLSGQNNNSGTTNGTVIATGVVNTGANANLNVRSSAGTNAPIVNRLTTGTSVSIYEKVNVNGAEWGRIGTNQWVNMAYIAVNNVSGGVVVTPGTVINGNTVTPGTTVTTPAGTGTGVVSSTTALNVRTGAGSNFNRVSSLNPGTTVNILEVVTVGNQQWGRIGTNQWVCMTYVRMNGTTGTTGNTGNTGSTGSSQVTTSIIGVVSSNTALNVRAAAGTNNAIVGKLNPGTTVTILEVTNLNGIQWGRISSGWVCMNYVKMSTANWH